jgi:oligosaccharide repeat unit polymerase
MVVVLLAAVVYRVMPLRISDEVAIYGLCLTLLGLTVWALWSWYAVTKSLFDFYVMFFLAAVLFNGGHALLELLNLNEDGILGGQFLPETVLQSLYMVVLGLTFFHLGALAIAYRHTRRAVEARSSVQSPRTAYYLRLLGWSMLIVSAVPSYLVLQNAVRLSLSEGYFALYQQQSSTGLTGSLDLLARFLTPGALFLLAGSKGRPLSLAVSALVVIGYTGANFLLGSRIEAGAPLLAYGWLWHRRIRPIPVPVLFASGIALLGLVFPFVKATRNLTAGAKLDTSALVEAYTSVDNPLIAIVYEMGSTLRTVAHTIQLVPETRGFDFGLSYLYAALTAFPNLFWDIHPTVARGLAAHWLVSTVSPTLASVGGGYGFSFIAEAYLNFGWVGVSVLLLLLGALLAAVVLWAQRTTDAVALALVASLGAFFLVFARGESGSIVRELVWYALGPYVAVRLLSQLMPRSSANRRISNRARRRLGRVQQE